MTFRPRALARRRDPATSGEAALAIAPFLKGLRLLAAQLVARRPGRTANELVNDLPRAESIRKRFTELERLGVIKPGPVRRCRITGKKARTWENGSSNGR